MKTIKYYLCFSILISVLSNLYSQGDLDLKYGRINTTNGEKIKVKNLVFENNQFRYYNNKNSAVNYMNLGNILKIEKKQGSHALEFGLGLGASVLLGGIIGTSSSYYRENQQLKTNYLISVTSIGLAVGIIWGLTQGKYKTVYTNPQYGLLNIKSDYSINPNNYQADRLLTYPQFK